MPLSFGEYTATLTGVVTVEEAQPLHEWLLTREDARVDLSGATHIHTAALQVMAVARPRVAAPCHDPFLSAWIEPLLTNGDGGEPA
jgi:anti-anti-sigma regulatory factor